MSHSLIAFFCTLSLSASIGAPAGQCLSFHIRDKRDTITVPLPHHLRLTLTKADQGWEAGVFRGKSQDNLLYPKRWHGACPCQITPFCHDKSLFPQVRQIKVRGYNLYVIIDLSQVTSKKEGDKTVFEGGNVNVSWSTKKPLR